MEYSSKFYYPKIEILNNDESNLENFNPKYLYSNYLLKISHMISN